AATVAVSDDDDPPPSLTPEISVTAGAGVTEGGIATFTVTATPAPKAPLVVAVTVSQQGDFGAATGIKSVAIPVTGSAQYSVSTVDDAADEADGSVGLKVNTGDGYTVSASRGTAAVAVADNDVPEISVSAGGDIDEGGDATYVVTADPAPASPLSATITVTQTGDFGATTGTSNVTIPTGGSVSHSIATTDDDADEPDGSVTLTLTAGSGYTVSSTSGAATVAVADNDVASAVTPEISVTAGAGVTEGGSASFTVTANPAPSTPLAVGVTIIQSGKFAAASVVGAQTVTIPSSGSVSHSIATTDDDADEPDGSITVSVRPLSGYTVSASRPAATVSVADNDAAPSATPASCVTTDATLLAQVKSKTQDPWNGARSDLVDTFTRAYRTMQGTDTYTVAVLKARPDRQTPNWQGAGPNALWQAIYAELDRLETCRAKAQTPPPPPATPEISVTAGADVTEGDTASFTITASPAPTSALTVVVVVTRSGEYGVAVGAQTVSIPTTGSVSHTVATSGDDVVEADGSVTVAVQVGSGYSASTSQGAATVAVSDDDAQTPPPPPPPPPVETPEVRVAAGPSVTEGGSASFTITASPAPTSPLTVAIKVTQSGDYGVSTGTKTVTVPTSGTLSHAIGTVNDGADETNGSVTVTLQAGTGYNVSSSHNAATVTVSDNDVPKISVTAGADVREGGNAVFTISASPTPASPLSVKLTISQSGDFGVSTGNQTITIPTSGSVQLMIGTSNDDVDESDGSATLTLKAGAGYTISLTSSAATVGVTDDDDPPPPPPPAAKPTVTIESASASEGADELVFRVTLSEATTETVRVSWWTSTNIDRDQRSARAGLDYEQWSGTITIAAGQTSGNGAVWLLQDKLTEGPEVFDIWLAPNVRGADIAVQHAMMTIIDDD
ncbi:MAG: hypothetical protein OXG27_00590, partial [Chloroflexi bacterium]|nr:hypothetical protein [Chloroflexota bacterium]